MNNPWAVVTAILTLAALYVLLPRIIDTFLRYRGGKILRCPETGGEAEVGIDAARAAFTSAFGEPLLRARDCSLWPERRGCGQGCLTLPEKETPDVRAGLKMS